jgi:dolichol-phosphate mannosyltransferase
MAESTCFISVVVPVYNEQDTLRALSDRVASELGPLATEWELVFVDDGSTDRSRSVITELHEENARIKALFLSRNFGQDAAVTAGLHVAQGDAVVLMDADLQDPPEVIPQMVAKWREGLDIVAGRRRSRKGERFLKRMTSFLGYRVMRFFIGNGLPADTGDFRLMDRAVVDAFRQYNQYNRFVRSLIASTGFRQTTVAFDRPARVEGKSKYTLRKSFGLATTGILNYSVAPLRLALWLGLLIMLGSIVGIVHWVRAAIVAEQPVPGWATLVVSIWFLGGVQCVLLGIVGEYVGRTYLESQRRPIYIVRESLGIDEKATEGGSSPRDRGRQSM